MIASENRSVILQARDLSRQVVFGGQPLVILAGINLTLHAGDTLAIVGRSGSGKSTLLGLLAGLDLPSHGDVLLAGQSLAALDEDGRARLRQQQIGFVFQNFQLLPALSALENVMLPLELAGTSDARARAVAMLERVGLADRLAHRPQELSGGEQQRVAVARAFVSRPALLLADEPTGNLDGDTGLLVADLLFELNREQGTTLVLVTHDTELARRCSHQVRLAGGRLVETEQSA